MTRVEKSIEVNVPVHTAYSQWTQFESFPHFMEGVEEVRRLDDRRLHWRAKVGTKVEEWDAVIGEQAPDERVTWQNTTGAEHTGAVRLDSLGPGTTRVHLAMSYDPEGFFEQVGDRLGFFGRRVDSDLHRFKAFVESHAAETAAAAAARPSYRTEHYAHPGDVGGMGGEYPERGSGSGADFGERGVLHDASAAPGPTYRSEHHAHPGDVGGVGGEYPERGA